MELKLNKEVKKFARLQTLFFALSAIGSVILVSIMIYWLYPLVLDAPYSYANDTVQANQVCLGDTELTYILEGKSSIQAGKSFIRNISYTQFSPNGITYIYPEQVSYLIASGNINFKQEYHATNLQPFDTVGTGTFFHGVSLIIDGVKTEPTILTVEYEVVRCNNK